MCCGLTEEWQAYISAALDQFQVEIDDGIRLQSPDSVSKGFTIGRALGSSITGPTPAANHIK